MNSNWWKDFNGEIGEHLKEKIDKLIDSQQFYPFVQNHEQDTPLWKEYGINKVSYNCYGDLDSNLLYATMRVNDRVYYGKIKSGLIHPHMRDRLFGMDTQDSTWFNWLTDIMCHIYVEGKTFNEVMQIWDKDYEIEKQKREHEKIKK